RSTRRAPSRRSPRSGEVQGPHGAACVRTRAQVRAQSAPRGPCGSAFGRPARRGAPTATGPQSCARVARMTARHLFIVYGLDVLIVLLSIGSAASANVERTREPFPRFQLLMPGLLAFAGAMVLLSYPDIRDLADPGVWLVSTVGGLGGACRGALMRLDSDHTFRLVRIWRGQDAAWAAWVMVLFAAVQGSLERALRPDNPYEA